MTACGSPSGLPGEGGEEGLRWGRQKLVAAAFPPTLHEALALSVALPHSRKSPASSPQRLRPFTRVRGQKLKVRARQDGAAAPLGSAMMQAAKMFPHLVLVLAGGSGAVAAPQFPAALRQLTDLKSRSGAGPAPARFRGLSSGANPILTNSLHQQESLQPSLNT